MNLKKYLALTRLGMMEKLHYRLGTFVTLFGNLIYLVLIYFLWKAIYASSGSDVVNGMTLNDTLVYLVLATALFNFLEVFLVWDMSREIQSGAIVLKLLKPMSFRGYSFWSYIGENIMSFFLTFLPTFIVINILTKGSIALGPNLLFFVLSVIMALVINFSIDMIVATICLYTESTWGINMVKECIVTINNDDVTVARYDNIDIQFPSVHEDVKVVYVDCENGKYKIVTETDFKNQNEKKTTKKETVKKNTEKKSAE